MSGKKHNNPDSNIVLSPVLKKAFEEAGKKVAEIVDEYVNRPENLQIIKEYMNNSIKNWSWEPPLQEGLYLACRGDVETQANIQPFKLVEHRSGGMIVDGWQTYSASEVAEWDKSFKFAALCVGSGAKE